jgi:copper chaperone CopZ
MRRTAVLLLAFLPGLVLVNACQSVSTAPAVEQRTLTLAITGMTCALNCPPRVKAALESVAGVESATIDYDARRAVVRCSASTGLEALLAAVHRQGFGAVPAGDV